jgi:hypothetical protein
LVIILSTNFSGRKAGICKLAARCRRGKNNDYRDTNKRGRYKKPY